MARHSSLRASDADRDAVAERLRRAAVEGRLESDELEERLHAALRARTYGELDRLLGDLPAVPARREHRRPGVARVAGIALVVALSMLAVLAIVSVIVVVAAMTMAWWLIGALVWLSLRAGRGSRARRLGSRPVWHRPPHARGVYSARCGTRWEV
jgi:Domain of unknown function (DUF1707)